MSEKAKRVYEFGPFHLDTDQRILLRDGEIVPLTLKVTELLEVLVENNGRIVSKDELLSEVWPDAVVDEGNINRNISTLRHALGEAGPEYIETIPKRGYRFVGDVREVAREGVVFLERTTRASVVIDEETDEEPSRRAIEPPRRSVWPWMIAVVLALLAIALFYSSRVRRASQLRYPIRLTVNPAKDVLPAWSPDGTRIAFTSNRDGQNHIYVMQSDGSNVKRLTNRSEDWDPTWSPDGSKLAFTSRRDGNPEIYVMNADGGNPRRLTDNAASEAHPVWSPDGKRIVFASNRNNANPYNFDIYVMNADGSNPIRLTDDPEFDSDPVWSPDGGKIAFVSARSGEFDLWVMNADGSDQRNLTPEAGRDGRSPAWSPDGSRIAFFGSRQGHNQICIIDPDGSNEIRLTSSPSDNTWPSWSPDGEQIVFQSDRDGNSEIYVISPDELTALTTDVADDVDPAWSPDASHIAFASKRDGDFEIYVMDADGGHQRRLTRSSGDDTQPAWSPDGRSIAFISRRDGKDDIYVMNADGSDQRKIMNHARNHCCPAWSADGKKIAFSEQRSGIYVANRDGTAGVQLPDTAGSRSMAWSPDGTRIVFESNRDIHYQIFVIDSSGKQLRKLTNDSIGYVGPPWHDSAEPAWSRDGRRIAFRRVIDNLGENMKLFTMKPDGTDVVRLTHNPAIDRNPAWSPDGKKIAFQSNRSGNFDIYVLRVGDR